RRPGPAGFFGGARSGRPPSDRLGGRGARRRSLALGADRLSSRGRSPRRPDAAEGARGPSMKKARISIVLLLVLSGACRKEAPAFEGKILRGYLYGRGAYDMKSLALAQALGMRQLKRHGIIPASDILFIGEADEEIGQEWGIRWILEHRKEELAGVENVLN